jgi:CubicO group peptidase (beta-lactamase class C family)
MKVLLVAVAALVMVSGPARAQPYSPEDQAHIAAIEAGLLPPTVIKARPMPARPLVQRMAETHVPAVSIAFFEDGHIRWAKAYGLADVASGQAATPQTLFQAASISKPVTAAAALRLFQDGKLDLDQDVNARLKAWKVPPTAFTAERKVTLRGLLSHTAGLTVHGFPGYPPDHALPSTVEILNGAPPANSPAVVSDARPGQRWSYSGGGYVVAQVLMTEATGEAFPALMKRLVLDPAGMRSSAYDQPLSIARSREAATGYFVSGQPLPGGRYAYPELAPAGLWTTPSDLARFAIALQDAHDGRSGRLLNQVTAKAMLTRQIDDFGLGLNLGPAAGPAMFEHGGSNQGFQSELRAFTGGKRQGVAIMTNGDGGAALIGEIARAVAQTYGWSGLGPAERETVQVDPAVLAAYAGLYEVPGITTVSVTLKDGRPFVVASALGPDASEMFATSPTRFFVLENGVTLEFVKDAQGAVTKARIGGPYGSFEAVRKLGG